MKKKEHERVQTLLSEAKNIVVLTGAGISTDSGIPDFRSDTGVYSGDEQWRYITRSYYHGYPKDFWIRFKDIFSSKLTIEHQPNRGHAFIATLNENHKVTVLTQNVDGLHQKAGSQNVLAMHGSIDEAICPKCKTVYDLPFINKELVPRCVKTNGKGKVCNFILKPDVVLFGDDVRHYKEAEKAIEEADLFIVMGSSLQVQPVNELPYFAKMLGIPSVIVNRESTEMDTDFDFVFHEEISDFLKHMSY